ncbi:zinc finger protein 431-like [Bradysia coprophila]|uniref:zinc finger protein 431-like n=1 Tax=Bradysia coprophila TaxID=38358 RepID=UPI00187D9D99|nr:zinc finger protein 431-like [Bradysia coprophila]XP_037036083.1 zinc finger protein 431-like [Bradysia coprophila]
MDMMEDVKPSIMPLTTQDTKIEIGDLPMKAGEVFRNNEGQYSFMCFHCGLIFEDFGEISNHCDSHFQEQKYDVSVQAPEFVLCTQTGTETELPDSSLSLQPERPELTPVEVPVKVSLESTRPATNHHVSVRKRKKRKIAKNAPLPNFPQNCPICSVWCDDFRGHMRTEHDMRYRILQCYNCKIFVKDLTTLKGHIISNNHEKKKTCYMCLVKPPITHPSEPRRHKCLFCKEWFPNHIEFKVHFASAHDKDADDFFKKKTNCNIFTCHICEREFPLRDYLHAHMRIHDDSTLRHQCPTCGRRLRTYGQLTQHLKVHEGKTFPCDQCDKIFPYYARLRLHRFTHATELKFECDQCSKKFKQKKYLLQHKATHTNERRYACKFCNASFNFTSGRRAHEKSQHKTL